MENNWKTHLDRWRKEGFIDESTFHRIVAFEAEQEPSRTSRIGVVLAIVLGVVLSTLSVFLFIAAHWDHLSPAYRMVVILSSLLLVHAIGAFTSNSFPALSQGMHTIGSLALGGAIYLTRPRAHSSDTVRHAPRTGQTSSGSPPPNSARETRRASRKTTCGSAR